MTINGKTVDIRAIAKECGNDRDRIIAALEKEAEITEKDAIAFVNGYYGDEIK